MASDRGILDGVVVLDFTRAVAGTYITRLLADMGADVLKIEAPEIGDGVRYVALTNPVIGDAVLPGQSPMFIFANSGKRSICMDLKNPESVALIKRLVTKADIVVENFTPHVMPGLGLSYDELRKHKPDLVMCSLTGYGQNGPLKDFVATDQSTQAMAGMAYLQGDPDGYPALAGNGIGDTVSGTMAAMAILAALFNRQRTGEGEYIDVSMLDAVMSVDCAAHPFVAATRGAFRPQRDKRTHFLMSPWGVFKGPNGRYFAMVGDWTRLCETLDMPEMAQHPDFADPNVRFANREKVHDLVDEALQRFPTDEAAFQAFVDHRAPVGPVLEPWEVQNHPQVKEREMVREVEYPLGKTIPTIATAPRFRNHATLVRRAPFVGEHNADILREYLQLPDEEIARLHECGALFQDAMTKSLLEAKPVEG